MKPARRNQLLLDRNLASVCRRAGALPALTDDTATQAERRRLEGALKRGEPFAPARHDAPPVRVSAAIWHALESGRRVARREEIPLYEERFEELELELAIVESMGRPQRLAPLVQRRYGTARDEVSTSALHAAHSIAAGLGVSGTFRERSLLAIATELLSLLPPTEPEPRSLPAVATNTKSMTSVVLGVAQAAGVPVTVRVEPTLLSRAAAGGRTVFIADSTYGKREATRLAVHEVLGHLVASANGRNQPLGIFAHGTAGSFSDQEGVAIALEEEHGLMDVARARTIAGRVIASDCAHRSVPFAEAAFTLTREHGFSPSDTIVLCERAYRGGGIARDIIYLRGWLRVRAALANGATLDELRLGRIGVRDLPIVRQMCADGRAREGIYGKRPRAEPVTNTAPVAPASWSRVDATS